MDKLGKDCLLRPLSADDFESVVDIDAALAGRRRPGFFEKRLVAALAEPDSFVYIGCECGGALQGYLIARLLGGEYGETTPVAVLDVIGVSQDNQGRGVGRAMLQSLVDILRHKGIVELHTQADWHNLNFLSFLSASGFRLAPVHVLERGVDYVETGAKTDPVRSAHATEGGEIDYSDSSGDDFEALARDKVYCRSLLEADLQALIRVDRKSNGNDRSVFYNRKVKEALDESGIRVSLVAEVDKSIVGFIMARVDFGEFDRTEPVAVLDSIVIDPGFRHQHIGSALLSQLLANLATLRLEKIRTVVMPDHFDVLGFLMGNGFHPGQRLTFSLTV